MSHAEAWSQSSHDIFREIDNNSGEFSIINRYGVVLIKESLTHHSNEKHRILCSFIGHSWLFLLKNQVED